MLIGHPYGLGWGKGWAIFGKVTSGTIFCIISGTYTLIMLHIHVGMRLLMDLVFEILGAIL